MEGNFSVKYILLLFLVVYKFNSISSACSCNDTDRVDKLEAKVQLLEHHLETLQRSLDTKQVKDNPTTKTIREDKLSGDMTDYSSGLKVDITYNESAFDAIALTPSPVANQVEKVAFYGRMRDNYHISPGKGQVLVFDDVVTDSGNYYNKYTGIFTVPSNGYYVFSWSIVTRNTAVFTQIVVNSNEKGGILSDNYLESKLDTCTGVVVIYVDQGDVVFIRTHPVVYGTGILSYPDQHSSFMGWKLF